MALLRKMVFLPEIATALWCESDTVHTAGIND